jgi:SpoVK/Ycf46/Vps4 family AAA+-type ATPase
MKFLKDFIILLKARYPIIYISTSEEERIEYLLKYSSKKYISRVCYVWNFVEGYQGNPNQKGLATKNPLEALEFIEKLTPETKALFILKDFDNFLKDFSIIRKLKNLGRSLKTQSKNIIIVSTEVNIPDSLRELITVVNFPLPTLQEICEELKRLTESLDQKISNDDLLRLGAACQGLSLERIRRVLSKIIAQYGEIDGLNSFSFILTEKKQIIDQSQLLEFCIANKKMLDLGGLENLKKWIKIRSNAFSQQAIEYGLPYPKGVLLVGVQGTGKSIASQIIACEWNLPLLRLDFGRLFGSLVGQSESRIRRVIELVETLAPCILWIDEIDKIFANSQSGGDNGTTNRVLATFITWLSEKSSPVFVVATANNIDWIPPEVIRKGRFDETFFLSLPNTKERESIFNVHLKKVRPANLDNYQFELLSNVTKNFSGAEIEQVVIDAMRVGFNEKREFNMEDLLNVIQRSVPLAKTKNKELQKLKEWADSGNISLAS